MRRRIITELSWNIPFKAAEMAAIRAGCHCGAIALDLHLSGNNVVDGSIPLCHCYGCRHSTGQLFASYVAVQLPPEEAMRSAKFTEFKSLDGDSCVTLHFCKVCGCHVLRSTRTPTGTCLQVASGTVTEGLQVQTGNSPQFGPHVSVSETIDGGLSQWLSNMHTSDDRVQHYSTKLVQPPSTSASVLQASCLCGNVQLQIEHPNEKSIEPWSYLADLLVPYHTQDASIKNVNDDKWWLRRNRTRYLAGTCACRSCRLVSGFEIQSWAFVPRANIAVDASPLDFAALHSKSVLQGYQSSQGVVREFCPTCGATVFWHGADRSDLIDVSVGLLCSEQGARSEDLLEWWTSRVSFAEDATLGRSGWPAERAKQLVECLQEAMRAKA